MATVPNEWPDPSQYDAPGPGSDIPFEDETLGEAIPDVAAPADADKTYQDQAGFSDIPPGKHELVILGFHGGPESIYVKCTVKDPRTGAATTTGYPTTKRTLKIGLASNPKASMLFDVTLPPPDPSHAVAYWHGIPEGKKAQGWHAQTFRGLIGAAVAPWPQGQPMPPMARFPANWVNRRFVGTIDPGEPYTDSKTGVEKMGKARLNQRSFQPAPNQAPLTGQGATIAVGSQGQGQAQRPTQQPPQPRRSAPAKAPAPAAAPVAPTEWQM